MGPLKCCETCVGKKPFLRGVLSGPVEIDVFQNHPRHSSLSRQTFDVWKEEYASMTNIHPWLWKTSSHRAFVNSVPMRCLDSILQWLENHNGIQDTFWIMIKVLGISHQQVFQNNLKNICMVCFVFLNVTPWPFIFWCIWEKVEFFCRYSLQLGNLRA